jgi:hypothetical protein
VNPVPVQISSSAFTWTSFFTGGSMVALLGLLIRQIGPWRKQASDEQQLLVANLQSTIKTVTSRLDKVEAMLHTERKMHFIQTARLEARHAAQRALDRHKFVNADANLDALLRILEVSPEKAPEAARQAREARMEQRKGEQLEAAEIHKAELLAVEMAERELSDQEERDKEEK